MILHMILGHVAESVGYSCVYYTVYIVLNAYHGKNLVFAINYVQFCITE